MINNLWAGAIAHWCEGLSSAQRTHTSQACRPGALVGQTGSAAPITLGPGATIHHEQGSPGHCLLQVYMSVENEPPVFYDNSGKNQQLFIFSKLSISFPSLPVTSSPNFLKKASEEERQWSRRATSYGKTNLLVSFN